jgi:hypothetical protein
MQPIPKKMIAEMLADPEYQKCAVDNGCGGALEFHHALRYAGRQVNEKFAIVRLCYRHHRGPEKSEGMAKAEAVALSRIAIEVIQGKYPKSDWQQRKKYLEMLSNQG